jgi:hypothetical protein
MLLSNHSVMIRITSRVDNVKIQKFSCEKAIEDDKANLSSKVTLPTARLG